MMRAVGGNVKQQERGWGNDPGMGLKWFRILMMDTFGLNQFSPTASNIILLTNPPVLDFGRE